MISDAFAEKPNHRVPRSFPGEALLSISGTVFYLMFYSVKPSLNTDNSVVNLSIKED